MKSIKTQAIILKRTDLGEADRLLTLFTSGQGKVKAVVKGAKKPLSRLAGHLEPFAVTACQLQEGRNFYTVTGAEVSEPFIELRDDLRKTSLAYYYAEMVDSLTEEDEPHAAIFNLLHQTLQLLEASSEDDIALLTPVFALKLLAELGYHPELSVCANCHEPLEPSDHHFSARLGGLLGPECQKADYVKLSLNTIKVLRLLLSQPIEVIYRLKPDQINHDELQKVTEHYINYHTERELRSKPFTETVRQ